MDFSTVERLLESGNAAEAITLLGNAASEGCAEAKFKLGMLYYHGEHVTADSKRARRWLEKADQDGHPDAPYYIGLIYTGNGDNRIPTRSDIDDGKSPEEIAECWYENAMCWYQRGAERGSHYAITRIGYNFLHGVGVAQSADKAYANFLKGKSAGNIGAHVMVVRMLTRGHYGLPGFLKGIIECIHIMHSIWKYRQTESVEQIHQRFEY